jgi:rhamnose utilization protein RhaD (predicted bifunctional aldolase and dehydrogenase)
VERLSRVLGARLGGQGSPPAVVFDGDAEAAWVAGTPEGRALVEGGPLTPDQIVYAGSWPVWLEVDRTGDDARLAATVAAALDAHVAAKGGAPVIFVAAGVGVLATGATQRRAETARQLQVDAIRVGFGALAFGGVRSLAPAERAFIESWEAEAYRVGLDAG